MNRNNNIHLPFQNGEDPTPRNPPQGVGRNVPQPHNAPQVVHQAVPFQAAPQTPHPPAPPTPDLQAILALLRPNGNALGIAQAPTPQPAMGLQQQNFGAFGFAPPPVATPAPAPQPAIPMQQIGLDPNYFAAFQALQQQILQPQFNFGGNLAPNAHQMPIRGAPAGLQMNQNRNFQNPQNVVVGARVDTSHLLQAMQVLEWQKHEAHQQIARLQTAMRQMEWNFRNASDQKDETIREKERMITVSHKVATDDKNIYEEERQRWDEVKSQMDRDMAILIQHHANLQTHEKLRHGNEMTVMKQKLAQAVAQHGAEIEQQKEEAVCALKMKMQKQNVAVTQAYEKELAEVKSRHQNEMGEMRKETEKSVRVKKDQEEQFKKREARLLEEKANLQKKVDELVLSQQFFSSLMSGAAKLFTKDGNVPSTSDNVNVLLEQGRMAFVEQINKEKAGQKRGADAFEASPIEEKKNKNEADEDED